MNYKSKYIIVEIGLAACPIVFSDVVGHDDIARPYRQGSVLGAGFCYIDKNGHYSCYGESRSLNIKSRGEEDSRILNKYLGVIHEY